MPAPLIDHIFLDYGNVCETIDGTCFTRGFSLHTGVNEDTLYRALYGDIHGYSQLFADYECGKIVTTQFFHQLTTSLDCSEKICFDEFAKLFVSVFTPNSELEELIARIQPAKRVYLLSNTNELVYARVISLNPIIMRYIPCRYDRIMSYDVGVIKPHPAIYRAALARANAKPETCLFIDDLEQNISAWQALGGHGIVYNAKLHPIAYLEEEIRRFGLLP